MVLWRVKVDFVRFGCLAQASYRRGLPELRGDCRKLVPFCPRVPATNPRIRCAAWFKAFFSSSETVHILNPRHWKLARGPPDGECGTEAGESERQQDAQETRVSGWLHMGFVHDVGELKRSTESARTYCA